MRLLSILLAIALLILPGAAHTEEDLLPVEPVVSTLMVVPQDVCLSLPPLIDLCVLPDPLPLPPALPTPTAPAPAPVPQVPSEPQNGVSKAPVAPQGTVAPVPPARPSEAPLQPSEPLPTQDPVVKPVPPKEDNDLDTLDDIFVFGGEDSVPLWITIVFAVVSLASLIYAASERRHRKRLDKRQRKHVD